jgi:hypothetical protein
VSLDSVVSRSPYTGDGTASEYDYAFRIDETSDLLVVVRDTSDDDAEEQSLELDVDFSVSNEGEDEGGVVSLIDAGQDWIDSSGYLASGWALEIRRKVPLTQLTDLKNQSTYYPNVVEKRLDRQVMIDQQQQDEIDRSVKLPETIHPADFDPNLPPVTVVQGILSVNEEGDGLEYGMTIPDLQAAVAACAASEAASASSADAATQAAAAAAASEAAASISAASASTDAATADAAATSATGSAAAAAASEAAAAASEAAALASETAAAASAASAATSEISAASSAAAASASETAAANSATAAANSAAAALASETAAATSETNAATSEANAAASAIAAAAAAGTRNIKTITLADSPYTVDPANDYDLVVDCSLGVVQVDAFAAAGNSKKEFRCKKKDNSANPINVVSADNIDGAGTFSILDQNDSYTFKTDGATFYAY